MTLPVFWSMALLTVQRSPSSSGPGLTEPDGVAVSPEEKPPLKSQIRQRSISECYFAMKGAALVLPQTECIIDAYRKSTTNGGNFSRDIQQHLQSMFFLLRPEDTLKMAVKLESVHVDRTRYLVVVSCFGNQNLEESCLLGVDCNESTTLGLVLPVWADVKITLDGDGGFSVSSNSWYHIFKPVSVQAMWSALQTLHKASDKAIESNYFLGGVTHQWIEYYEKKIDSDRSCLNEWHAMDDLESRRPPSPDYRKYRRSDREAIERDIKSKLKEVMMTVDLDEVTSKHIRTKLEQDLHMDLQEYRSFIDEEMLTIMGQMDTSTEIFDHLFLGSEWNASNLEELQRNGVGHILNVTREIDNFFPGMFDYLNIRVYDEEGTELLKHWDKTYKFITDAKEKGSKVLVHCKMGVSRSASVVIAYIMKANNWKLHKAFHFVKERRNCVQPNQSFMKQLETYQGILDASNHRHNTLWRSKSENNLKKQEEQTTETTTTSAVEKTEEKPSVPELYLDIQNASHRPKSWSPDENIADMLFPENVTDSPDVSKNHVLLRPACLDGVSYSVSPNKALHLPLPAHQQSEPIRFAIGNDDSPIYDGKDPMADDGSSKEIYENDGDVNNVRLVKRVSSIKDRINELESQAQLSESKQGTNRDLLDLPEKTGLVLNLANQFESVSKSTPASPVEEEESKGELFAVIQSEYETYERPATIEILGRDPVISQTKPPATKLQAVLVRPETWGSDKPVEILRANSEMLLTATSAEANETRRHSTNELQCCKSEGDVIMRLRVNNQSKDLNCDISSGTYGKEQVEGVVKKDSPPCSINRPISFRAEDILNSFPISRSHTQEITHSNPSLSSTRGIANGSESPDTGNRSPPVAPKPPDLFSAHLDKVFDKDEQFAAAAVKLSTQNGVDPSKRDHRVCDSAIGNKQTLEPKSAVSESTLQDVKIVAVRASENTCCVVEDSKNDLKDRSVLSDLIRPHSWQTGANNNNVKVEEKVGEEDCLLKRASSLDGSLPSRSESLNKTQQQQQPHHQEAGASNGQVVDAVSDIPLAGGIQRSQSLRNSPTYCKHSSGVCCDTPKVVRIHGPKPYRSPSEKQAPCILDGATIMANGVKGRCTAADGEVIHYASAPILYKDNPHEYPTVPKAATSQPNITTVSCLNSPTCKSTSKPPLTLDLHHYNESVIIETIDGAQEIGRTSPNISNNYNNNNNVNKLDEKEVPLCSGIVKQHKEVLESKIASSSVSHWSQQKNNINFNNAIGGGGGGVVVVENVEHSPPIPPSAEVKQQCDKADEWKILQCKLHQQMQMVTDTSDDGSPPGKVKRMTRQMELATSSSSPVIGSPASPPVSTTVLLPASEIRPDLIILDQNGKEVTTDLPQQSLFSAAAVVVEAAPLNSVTSNPPMEDKSVKSLVDKFEVKEKPRQRYFSETDVENLTWSGSANANVVNIVEYDVMAAEDSLVAISPSRQEECSCPAQSTRKRGAECDSLGQCQSTCNSARESVKIEIDPPVDQVQLRTNRNGGRSTREKWATSASNRSLPPPNPPPLSLASDDELISSENGVPHRKVRKAHGKSHPLSKLQNGNKQRHVSPFYSTM